MDIELICEVCGKKFLRRKAEVNRNKKLGRRVYCSLECVGKDNLDNIPAEKRYHPENLLKARNDEFTPFRYHYRCAKRRSHVRKGDKAEFTITLQDVKKQWEKQKGICPYTGWKMANKQAWYDDLGHTMDRASLDRIDSSKGYIKDNIQFVSMIAQYAKNGFTNDDLIKFCKAVVKHHK